jgi:uncharacterized membrane protein
MIVAHYIYYFALYSFIGWAMEVAYMSLRSKRFVNRGFLNGPFCPVYGFGTVSVIMFSDFVTDGIFPVFLFGFFFLSVIEYVTSLMLEKMFGARWWSYYDQSFNIAGRVAFVPSLFWGISSVIFVTFVHPEVRSIVSLWPSSAAGAIIASVLALYFIVDMIISSLMAWKLGRDMGGLSEYSDITDIIKNLSSSERRIALAFPDLISELAKKILK